MNGLETGNGGINPSSSGIGAGSNGIVAGLEDQVGTRLQTPVTVFKPILVNDQVQEWSAYMNIVDSKLSWMDKVDIVEAQSGGVIRGKPPVVQSIWKEFNISKLENARSA